MITKNENCGESSYEMLTLCMPSVYSFPHTSTSNHTIPYNNDSMSLRRSDSFFVFYFFCRRNTIVQACRARKRADYEFLTLWLFYCPLIFHQLWKIRKNVVCNSVFFLFSFSFRKFLFACGKSLFWNTIFLVSASKMAEHFNQIKQKATRTHHLYLWNK